MSAPVVNPNVTTIKNIALLEVRKKIDMDKFNENLDIIIGQIKPTRETYVNAFLAKLQVYKGKTANEVKSVVNTSVDASALAREFEALLPEPRPTDISNYQSTLTTNDATQTNIKYCLEASRYLLSDTSAYRTNALLENLEPFADKGKYIDSMHSIVAMVNSKFKPVPVLPKYGLNDSNDVVAPPPPAAPPLVIGSDAPAPAPVRVSDTGGGAATAGGDVEGGSSSRKTRNRRRRRRRATRRW